MLRHELRHALRLLKKGIGKILQTSVIPIEMCHIGERNALYMFRGEICAFNRVLSGYDN